MLWILTIIAFVVIFSLLILVHEFGHFIVAKKCGIKVEEFGMGLPPKIWGYKPKHSDTTYTINAIPFGGFVRLYGEDTRDAKLLKHSNSYAAKPAWMKIAVVVAGVLMNFILAFILLTIGFWFGIQPLIVDDHDLQKAIDSGVVQLEQGLIVKAEGENKIGFQAGDRIVSINNQTTDLVGKYAALKDQEQANFNVERAGKIIQLQGVNDQSKKFVQLYDPMVLPDLKILKLDNDSPLLQSGVSDGVSLASYNDKRILDSDEFIKEYLNDPKGKLEVVQHVQPAKVLTAEAEKIKVIITEVMFDSPASKAGLQDGDLVVAINDMKLDSVEKLPEALKKNKDSKKVVYQILRGDSVIDFFIDKNEQGLVGVALSEIKYDNTLKARFYSDTEYYSILKISDVKLGLLEAPVEAFKEMGRLSVLTAKMFVGVFAKLFTQFSVPEGVAGPVGIAQMTFVFVQEGFLSLVRFTAILSLSLGIINILPFPGLDGGRLFLIVLPLIFGKKLNHQWEAIIHLVGFVVLMVLIFLVTFNDIARLFSS